MTRHEAIDRFLAQSGWKGATRTPIAGDASLRRYERIKDAGRRAILMDAPPDVEDVRPFIAVLNYLREQDLSAPALLSGDVCNGFLLLEDLGDNSFNHIVTNFPDQETMLYKAAVDLLVTLHSLRPPERLPTPLAETQHRLPPYDDALLLKEASLFTDWYLPALGNSTEADQQKAAFKDLWLPLFAALQHDPQVLVLRDYHVDNLMWLPDRDGVARVGLLDFQDAVIGHPAYDLVSLLQDARRDVAPELEQAMIDHYLVQAEKAGRPHNPETFRLAYHVLGAQRAAKIIGIFTRLYRRDKKPRYLALIPRVWSLLERNLAGEDFTALDTWLSKAAPEHKRIITPQAI